MARITNNAMDQWLSRPGAQSAPGGAYSPLAAGKRHKAIAFALDRVLQQRPSSVALPAGKDEIRQMVDQALQRAGRDEAPSLAECCRQVVDAAAARRASLDAAGRKDLARIVGSTAGLVARTGPELARQAMGIEKAAKDFESLLFSQLIDSMRKTIDEEGLLEGDGTSKQMRDLYWMFLGRQAGTSGSLGMWKQLAGEMSQYGNLTSGQTDFEV
jgi:hypothetical protein